MGLYRNEGCTMQTPREFEQVKFQVSLSNGQTFYEGKGEFQKIPGELSPWNKLIQYTIQNKCLITSLCLYTDKGQRFNLPSAGKNPKFKAFIDTDKPYDYRVFRSLGSDIDGDNPEWFTVAEAIYKEYKLQIWVDEMNPDNCWVLKI